MNSWLLCFNWRPGGSYSSVALQLSSAHHARERTAARMDYWRGAALGWRGAATG
uniref:Uncharacterized protein n=1 Tax=Arundo donax TaxID=35708 RepID=A0A0A9HTB0_ARUDO